MLQSDPVTHPLDRRTFGSEGGSKAVTCELSCNRCKPEPPGESSLFGLPDFYTRGITVNRQSTNSKARRLVKQRNQEVGPSGREGQWPPPVDAVQPGSVPSPAARHP